MQTVVLLALLGAMAYGASDFVGGLLSRSAAAARVAVVGQGAASVLSLVAAVVVGGVVTAGVLGWGAGAGLGAAVGTLALYRGLSVGRMNVAGPLSAVGAAGLPVLVDVLLGQTLSSAAVVGIGLAIPAIWLVSTSEPGPGGSSGVVEGLLAGVGFAALFICLDRAGDGAGMWAVFVSQLVSLLVLLGYVVLVRPVGGWPGRHAVWPGVLGVAATILFLVASRLGSLSVAAVIVSLYPAMTVVLAALVLHERTTRLHAVGLALCAASVITFTVG